MLIAIYGSRRQHDNRDNIKELLVGLTLGGVQIVMAGKLYDHLAGDLGMSLGGVERSAVCPAHADMALSIGGDGTFLRTVAWVGMSNVPVLGINTGHLGYLTAMTLPQAVAGVDRILNPDFTALRHTLLQVDGVDVKGPDMALNEIVVAKEDSASMISAKVHIDGHFLADYKADGIIVATPTGSTAYNLSVGGPIVQPGAPVWVLSPIAAHSLNLRPFVVADNSTLTIRVDGRGQRFRLVLDGRATSLPMGTTVTVRRAPHCVTILQPEERNFTHILSEKLSFNG